jgi:4-hydroxy 2-oxovalerate aldolase
MKNKINLLDCTLRDGGYYNSWDFSSDLLADYFKAMESISIDCIEVGFRTLNKNGFKGGCGYSTDKFIRNLKIPSGFKIAVMINAGEFLKLPEGLISGLEQLFSPAQESPVSVVRVACHLVDIEPFLLGVEWLKEQGYLTTINFMQIADRTDEEIINIAGVVADSSLDILYFADSMGSLNPDQTAGIIKKLRSRWKGDIGIHTHNNQCLGVVNSMRAIDEGVTWVDGTVTGMGRGPGNAQTEYLTIELEKFQKTPGNPTKLFTVINKHFKPMQQKFGWGPNPFYYLAGKYAIHPTYIQQMIGDTRYDEEDLLTVMDHLRKTGSKKFDFSVMESARNFYDSEPKGTWIPSEMVEDKEVLILGSGPGVKAHQGAIENFIKIKKPLVVALNTQTSVVTDLVDIRAACHPVRLLADCNDHISLPQPLVTPASQLPESVLSALKDKKILDFGLEIQEDKFVFNDTHCILPMPLVIAYVLAFTTSGRAKQILLAGFDGYGADDPRTIEMDRLLDIYKKSENSLDIFSITPTKYKLPVVSVYAL